MPWMVCAAAISLRFGQNIFTWRDPVRGLGLWDNPGSIGDTNL